MRTFLITALLAAVLTAQDLPPVQERTLELTPTEVELVDYYLDLRTEELKANPATFGKIRQKYDDLVRRALGPEKYPLAKLLMGC